MDNYRFGFNGKENDNEVKGTGNQQDYGMRIYDPRIARFLSVDPIASSYPMLTPYQFASNRPIDGVDLDGLEYVQFGDKYVHNFSKETKEQVEAKLAEYNKITHGNISAEEILRKDNDNEYWTVYNRRDIYGNSSGTRVRKYASMKSYYGNGYDGGYGHGKPYSDEIRRDIWQWLYAKDESLEGREGFGEGMTILAATVGTILSAGGFALFEASAGAITLFTLNTGLTIDDISAIGDENTMLEKLAMEYGGKDAVYNLQVAKLTLSVFNVTKGTIDFGIDLKNGDKVKATYDAINKIWTQTNLVQSTANAAKK